ncbi:hypothetical protein UA08_03953 [Talaromyces atroroseus]|uniref:NADP-dependent oxidoreductase domain-containing protein n=1 Tax=Talaromyces atroroseus TaxID=1441469 RepID=A0A1Q5Q993_TALAT|nr:hypothetical protein UA08_03953 [Talaromyces atroroseus]OKL60681.1 hypothetical protein UA08_03953 [Talaromyces atroroseus]
MTSSSTIPKRAFGKLGPELPRLGFGLMNASGTYNLPGTDAERLALLDHAYSKGQVFWDTADKYGDSEEILGKWFAANPEKRKDIFLATKFGIQALPDGRFTMNSTPEYCRECIGKSLKRLGLPYVDLYYIHRLDKVTPVERTVQSLVALKNEGKIKYLGISECSAESLRRAHAVHPITALQIEYSLFCRDIESPKIRLLQTARELGVAVVCYSPLGNGFLTGRFRTIEDVSGPGDSRKVLPWFSKENLNNNLVVLDKIAEMAKTKGATSAQLSLAWLLAQGDDIFPIPGTSKPHRLDENLASASVSVSPKENETLRKIASEVTGERFQTKTGYAFTDTPKWE